VPDRPAILRRDGFGGGDPVLVDGGDVAEAEVPEGVVDGALGVFDLAIVAAAVAFEGLGEVGSLGCEGEGCEEEEEQCFMGGD